MAEYYDFAGKRHERITAITRRLAEIHGGIVGIKPDRSPEAQQEATMLREEWEALADLNITEARQNMPTHIALCRNCGHQRGIHHAGGNHCFYPCNPDEYCDCPHFERASA